jgi:undecaprenyl-diphosphatase
MTQITVGNALLIGLAQALAVIPGSSRAGTTITMARLLGFERRDAARFSMMLSIPAIAGAGLLQGIYVMESGDAAFQTDILIATGLAFIAALLAIIVMMSWLQRQSFTPFVFYRIALGVVILWLAA